MQHRDLICDDLRIILTKTNWLVEVVNCGRGVKDPFLSECAGDTNKGSKNVRVAERNRGVVLDVEQRARNLVFEVNEVEIGFRRAEFKRWSFKKRQKYDTYKASKTVTFINWSTRRVTVN